ncbi:MAG: T9SS type A sorting domain-containing protein [Bacteroidetes bacterium]|nr:T9SS type A sorting domain-containing protein [Bacteroidota bacterium]
MANEKETAVKVKILDVLGRDVFCKEETMEPGVTVKKINIAFLGSGTYLLQVSAPEQMITRKQVVIK